MTLSFDAAALESRISPQVALDAMREAFAAEARGETQLPHRIDTPTKSEFLRVMPAVLDDVMGLKVMTLVERVGNRYLILLYDVNTGELLALFDADELTRVRTAATTALAAAFMCQRPPTELGIVGVLHESGDVADSVAAGVFSEKRMIPIAQLSPGHAFPPLEPERDLLVFKSVGAPLQDLALARALYRDTDFRRRGVDTGELTMLKPFSARATANAYV